MTWFEQVSGSSAPSAVAADSAWSRALLDAVATVAWVTTRDGVLSYANQRWSRYTGLGQEPSAPEWPGGVLHPEDVERYTRAWQEAVRQGAACEIDGRLRGRDGAYRWFVMRAEPLRDGSGDGDGAPVLWLTTALDVDDRRQAEESSRRERDLFERFFDAVPTMLTIYDPSTKVLRVNAAFARLVGWSSRELANVSLMEEVYPDPAYREEARRFMEACSEHWKDFRVRARDGRILETTWANIRLSDNTQLGIGIDITARKQSEEQLRESEERFQLVARATNDSMWDLDLATGRMWSSEPLRAGSSQGGAGTTQWVEDWAARVHPEDLERVQATFRAALAGKDLVLFDEYRFRQPDGNYAHVLDRSFIVRDASGRATRVLCALTDITERKQAEVALRASEEALREADRRKDEFLATLAHELRNPLAPIVNAVQMLRDARDRKTGSGRALPILERQLGLMIRLVDDLLDISRITRGKISLRQEPVDLAAIAERAVESSRPVMQAVEHHFEVQIGARPIFVKGDPARLEQVLLNLLNNAAKFTPAGGSIQLSVATQADQAVMRVRDTGIGIAPEVLPVIFEMFVQADQKVDRAHGGLGIGLSLVRSLVALHGGQVTAESGGIGKGSEFVVRLPLLPRAEAHAHQVESARASDHAGDEAAERARRVLIVDDNQDAADSLAALLTHLGHEVSTALDGRRGIELARELEPDAIVMDLGMPGLSGYDVARALRADPRLDGVLLIALSGWGQEEARRESKAAGFDRHLVKPADPEALCALLAEPQAARRA